MEAIRQELRAFTAAVQRQSGVPGIAVALSTDRGAAEACAGVRALGADAPLGPAHRFHAGCVTKLLLALVALELHHTRALTLDAPLRDYLPELRGSTVGAKVRVEHLLSHTSGYRGTSILDPQTRSLDWPSFVAYLRAAPQLFEPGTAFSYEHTEAVLLGAVLERVTGTPCLALVRDRVLEPLEIVPGSLGDGSSAGHHEYDAALGRLAPLAPVAAPSPFWVPAFSSFTLSARDLAAIARAAVEAGRGRCAWLSRASVGLLVREAIRLPPAFGGPLSELLPTAFGLGAAHLRGGRYGATGLTRGQCVALRFDPATGIAAAVGMNAVSPPLRDRLLEALYRDVLRIPEPEVPAPRLDFEPGDWTGVYIGPGRGVVAVSAVGAGLRCEIGREQGGPTLAVDLERDAVRGFVLRSPLPQLSLAFFRAGGEAALMLGLSAFRRVRVRSSDPGRDRVNDRESASFAGCVHALLRV
ncbi:MAG TPA: serine hydrolase domain-containing protein [Gammaproteobacteria bacterium]